jgi:hypothetical protein
MLRVRRTRGSRDAIDVDVGASHPSHRILALQRTIGNRAVHRLLQREVIRELGSEAGWDPKAPPAEGVIPLYEQVAELAQAKDVLRDVKATKGAINTALRAKDGEKEIKPGLNFVAKLEGDDPAGEAGFVGADGVYAGPRLPVTASGDLPKVAVMLSGPAFARGKANAFGVLRHEIEHAKHMERIIDRLAEWRKELKDAKLDPEAARLRFDKWTKARTKGDEVEQALLAGERDKVTSSTELLAYVEGFVSVFHLGPQTPSFGLIVGGRYPPAIHQLWKAAKHSAGAAAAVRRAGLERIRAYVTKALTGQEQEALRQWLDFLLRAGAQKPATTDPAEVNAAKLVHVDMSNSTVRAFLEEVAKIAAKKQPAKVKAGARGR